MTIPTREWNHPSEGHAQGTFTAWDASQVDADDMVNALVTQFAANFYGNTTVFDNYIIYSYEGDPDGSPLPFAGNTLAITGSGSPSGQQRSVQTTLLWRTELFHFFKIVLLDSDSAGDFTDTTVLGTGTPQQLVDAEVTNIENAWSGRDNTIPTTFHKRAKTLNHKLEKRPGN
jgi:hypothetical protein